MPLPRIEDESELRRRRRQLLAEVKAILRDRPEVADELDPRAKKILQILDLLPHVAEKDGDTDVR